MMRGKRSNCWSLCPQILRLATSRRYQALYKSQLYLYNSMYILVITDHGTIVRSSLGVLQVIDRVGVDLEVRLASKIKGKGVFARKVDCKTKPAVRTA